LKTPAISIIIRSFNEAAHIGRLLAGVYAQTVRDFEVIIVDSGSTDGTVEAARKWPVRTLAIDPRVFSFGRSLNIGCAAARGEYLVFTSAHCYPVRSNWLEKLVAPLTSREIAVSYGKQRGNGRSRFSEQRIFAQWFPDHPILRQSTPFYNNANAAARRSLWKALPFNEELTGLEDLEWGKRLLERGYYISYTPEAEVVHEHNETYRRIYNRYLREAIAIHRVMPEESFSLLDFGRLFMWNILKDYRQARREEQLIKQLAAVPSFRLMQFWGTYRGYARRDGVNAALRKRFYYPAEAQPVTVKQEPTHPASDVIDYAMMEKLGRLGVDQPAQPVAMRTVTRFYPTRN